MYIGLDLGTSGLKGIVLNDAQDILAEATTALTNERPQDGWSEQDPASWLVACDTVMRALAEQTPLGAVRGIGLSGHMHGATILGADDRPLRPCMLWNDTRSHGQAKRLDNAEGRRITGNIVFPGFTAPKVMWVQEEEAEVAAQMRRILLPKDYLRLWLTGEAVSDMSDASGTSWLDVGARDWSEALLLRQGLSRAHMPRLVEGSQVSGTVRGALAADWGLPDGVVVAGGGGDNAASAVGVGVVEPGTAFVSLGTSGVLFAASGKYQPDAASAVHTFCHALPDRWHQMGVILAAADALNWWAGVAGQTASELTAGLGALQAPGRSLFLPYLGGERTPHNDAQVRGQMLHLEHGNDLDALTRTVIEGITHAFRDSYNALTGTGTQINRLIGVGGGTNADYWVKAIATALNMPVELPVAGDFGGAFGAARLGMMAAGAGQDVAGPPQIAKVVEPERDLVEAFGEAHLRYRTAYAAIKSLG